MKFCLRCNSIFTSEDWTCTSCGYAPDCVNQIQVHAPEFANVGEGFKAEYFPVLASLEAANFWFRARNELIVWALQTYKPYAKNLLEVGCGTGFVLSGISSAFPDILLSGSEISFAGLKYAADRVPSACLMQMDARHIPFVHEFDAIGLFDVMEHINEDEAVLAQIHKALKPGGVLLLTVPQHQWLWSSADEYACHVRRYTSSDLHKKVHKCGFSILRSSSFVSLLLPAMLISRKRKHGADSSREEWAELKISPSLNLLFYRTMKMEQRLMKWGLDFPFGGSRLLVVQKKS